MATTKLTGFENHTAQELKEFINKNRDNAFKLHALGLDGLFEMVLDACNQYAQKVNR
jgi:hypothetical protein